LFEIVAAAAFAVQVPNSAFADFTPGGTLVDREVGVTVGNPEASASRKPDNSNVLFDKDYYFKFGVAAPWIEPDTTDFPKTVPFTRVQQRYDTLKKYGDRVKAGIKYLIDLETTVKKNEFAVIPDASSPEYALRPMGLLANGFLASENTGATNELFLAHWYVNEVWLRVGDFKKANDQKEAKQALEAAKKAVNSYLTLMNRVLTPKVGDKFEYV